MNDVDPLARIVDEHLIARDVILTHHGRESPLKLSKQVTESADMLSTTYQQLCCRQIYVARAAALSWEPASRAVFDAT